MPRWLVCAAVADSCAHGSHACACFDSLCCGRNIGLAVPLQVDINLIEKHEEYTPPKVVAFAGTGRRLAGEDGCGLLSLEMTIPAMCARGLPRCNIKQHPGELPNKAIARTHADGLPAAPSAFPPSC